jgi:uncharacterized protein DUF4430
MRRGLAVLAITLAGCGLGPGKERGGGAELRVTRDFGERLLASAHLDRVREDQTVMRFLTAERRVKTRYGGRFVQAIDGLEGKGATGRRDWFFFVNGIESPVGAAELNLSPGDVVQWDYRRWDAAMSIPAIVGAYPEPLLHGVRGKRLPVRLECGDGSERACDEVSQRLSAAGVHAARATLGTTGARKVIRVIVARWDKARLVQSVRDLERGPQGNGVFARFAGRRLELLGQDGHVARTAAPGSGLVAALHAREDEFIWLVSAPDERGVDAAARSVSRTRLRDAFAVATTPAGTVKLPVEAP